LELPKLILIGVKNESAKDIAAALKVSVSQIDLTEEIHSN